MSKYEIKNICCIGAGYVGGPTMAVFAKYCKDIKITVCDIIKNRIDAWNSTDTKFLPIYEPELDTLISECRNKNLFFTTDIKNSIENADMIFLSVNTPTKLKGIGAGKASDLKWVEASARQIAEFATGHTIVVEKSTLPVRTAKTIEEILFNSQLNRSFGNSKTFSVLSNPEFLSEGSAIKDLQFPDRVLIGGQDHKAIESLANLYINWVPKNKILRTNIWSSELSKLTANAFLAQRISSINTISALCEVTEADVKQVSNAIGLDSRIGDKFLEAGPGFGGSCFKKDILNLVYLCRYYGLNDVANYWEQVMFMNNWQKHRISSLIIQKLFGTVSNKKILILGFSFKPETNDTRESPAIEISKDLIENGAELLINDPVVSKMQIEMELGLKEFENNNRNIGKWQFIADINKSADNADAMVVVTEWEDYKNLNWRELSDLLRKPSWIFDTRGIIPISLLRELSSYYWQIGSPSINY